MTEAKKKEPGIGMLAVILLAICAVCSLLLGLVNEMTKDRIADIAAEKQRAAMQEVLPADNYTPVTYTGGNALVQAVYSADGAGYVVQVAPSGFGGALDIMVGVAADGTVSGVSVVSHSETAGLGAKAKSDAAWREQFVGKSGTLAVTKDGGEINAITGATITSRAVTSGVNAALEAAASLG